MSPNGTSSICCCSRVFRRSSSSQQTTNPPNNSHLEPIEIKVNGQPHLMVPHVAIRPTPPAPTIPIQLAPDTLSEINLELFETARTSRTNDSKLHPMTELIRMTRIEEGLEVTPRVDTGPSTSILYPNMSVVSQPPPPLETIPEISEREIPKNRSKPKKAVFNEDGDITTRSSNSRNIVVPPIFSITNAQRRVSSESIGVPIITIPSQTSISIQQEPSRALIRSSPISRRISATPQMITALVAYTYAFYASNEAWRELSHLKRTRRSVKRYNSEPIASVNGEVAEICLKECQEKPQNCSPGPQGSQGKAGRDGKPGEPGIDGTNEISERLNHF